MAQRRMSRKSFRKSKGRKTRSMRKSRKIGGAAGDEEVMETVTILLGKIAVLEAARNRADYIKQKNNILTPLITKLTSRRTSCKWSMFKYAECEEKKAEYYFAAAFALLSQINPQNIPEFDIRGKVQMLFDKGELHSSNEDKEENRKKGLEYAKDILKKENLNLDRDNKFLSSYNEFTKIPEHEKNMQTLLTKIAPALTTETTPTTETTTAPTTETPAPAPASEGGRKSRRKRKSRRR